MEKTCEFCKLYKPVVYCKSDAAHLCLSCDSRVHSANALSNRHPRTLICESCRYRPAHVRCSDHQMFMCRGCDCTHHDFSSEHDKRLISSFTGSPSAKELAALWGFDLSELENSTLFVSTSNDGGRNGNLPKQYCSQSGSSSVVSTIESMTTTISAKLNIRSRSKHTKASRKVIQQDNNSLVLQQILDLKRLQLSESSYNSSSIHVREPTDDGSTRKLRDNCSNILQKSEGGGFNDETATEKPFPLPFSQLDQLSDSGNSLNGDSFWQCKSPLQNNQLWAQNMQDLGVCDEHRCMDDFNMPDFDLTFKNYEEMFGGEQDLNGSVVDEKDNGIADHFQQFMDSLTPINQPSYSALSFTHSRFSAESSANDYVDTGLSHLQHGGETLTGTHKEKNSRRHEVEKEGLRPCYKKSKSDVKKRVKSLSIKEEGYESDTAILGRSF